MSFVSTTYQGRTYRTSERAYMTVQCRNFGLDHAAKIIASARGLLFYQEEYFAAGHPNRVKARASKALKYFKHPEDVRGQARDRKKAQVMLGVVWAKFSADGPAQKALLNTGLTYLVEGSPHDRF